MRLPFHRTKYKSSRTQNTEFKENKGTGGELGRGGAETDVMYEKQREWSRKFCWRGCQRDTMAVDEKRQWRKKEEQRVE